MAYYDEVIERANRISLWADLRHEQGASVEPILEKLRRDLDRAEKRLQDREPPPESLRREPNDLERIKAVRPEGPRRLVERLSLSRLRTRLRGAWLGRAAGCTLGAPVEGWAVDDMESLARNARISFPPTDYWTTHPRAGDRRYGTSLLRDYLRGGIRAIPVDDDLAYTLLGLLILEKYGARFRTDDVAKAWLEHLPMACTAEHVALENLRAGAPARKAGSKGNPYQEWIGAAIRADPWGYAAAGWPERAAEMAYHDAYLSHRQNGIYGAMFFSAAVAAAFVLEDPLDAIEVGLTEVPQDCRLAQDVRWALGMTPKLRDWRKARAAVDERFPGMSPVHTNNNACLTVFGLALGKKDFTRTIGVTVAMGLDNDCTAATAGSILGATIGAENIPDHWWKPFRNRTRTYLRGHEWFRNTDIVERFARVARVVCEG